MDNDVYGHINNVIYYSYFDTVINRYLIEVGGLDIQNSPVIGVTAETRCQFFESVSYPEELQAGLRVKKIGNSSVVYNIGIFQKNLGHMLAAGYFVHVFVNRSNNQPISIPYKIREALNKII
ncbi:MAG: thioesterase [Magnetovibrio sp.]|nr:thioesterase [Magnetovibrio sp.]